MLQRLSIAAIALTLITLAGCADERGGAQTEHVSPPHDETPCQGPVRIC
jgi:hypothetical protein